MTNDEKLDHLIEQHEKAIKILREAKNVDFYKRSSEIYVQRGANAEHYKENILRQAKLFERLMLMYGNLEHKRLAELIPEAETIEFEPA